MIFRFSCLLPTAVCLLFLERLREPELELPLLNLEHGGGRIKRVQILRNQKPRRIHQKPVIDGQCAAERRLEAKTEPDRVTPTDAQVLRVHIFDEIARWSDRLPAEDVADAPEYIAAVIK